METKILKISVLIFLALLMIFIGVGRISFNYLRVTVYDLGILLMGFMDTNPANYLVLMIFDNTIKTESNMTSLCLNLAWFGILFFLVFFNILNVYYIKKKRK